MQPSISSFILPVQRDLPPMQFDFLFLLLLFGNAVEQNASSQKDLKNMPSCLLLSCLSLVQLCFLSIETPKMSVL